MTMNLEEENLLERAGSLSLEATSLDKKRELAGLSREREEITKE
jgi:hypothetical protein